MLLRFLLLMVLTTLAACVATPAPTPVAEKIVDSDADGVIDALDRCPETQPGIVVDAYGCPADSDRDGIFDFRDQCPSTPHGYAVDSNGCPLDTDADGVVDSLDQCPETPVGIVVDMQGCPVPVAPPPPETLELRIGFHTGLAILDGEYDAEFSRGAIFISAHPQCSSVIEGHTDNVGPEDYNITLSRQRAEVARDKLIAALGAPLTELTVAGYGESRPVAENSTQQGRQQNRRVVIAITCDPQNH